MISPPEPKPEPAEQEAVYLGHVAEIRSRLEAILALPGLERFRETRALPRAFFEHFHAFLAEYDKLIDFVLTFSGDDRRIQCRKGCANCCIDLVRGMTTPEVIAIYHHVRSWPDAKQLFEYHKESTELFINILFQKVPNPAELEGKGGDDRIAESHLLYNMLNRPCGFLDQQTGCCRIYPVRPLACRYFFSLDPPETCTPLHVKYLNRQTRLIHLPAEIHALIREIDRKFGFRPLNYLCGAFCQFAAEIMRIKPISVLDDDRPAAAQPQPGEPA